MYFSNVSNLHLLMINFLFHCYEINNFLLISVAITATQFFYLWILFCRRASSVSDIALVKCWCDLTKGQKQFLVVNHIIICVVYTCVYIFVLFKYLYYSLFLSVIIIWKYYVCYGLKHLINDFFNSLLYRW